MSVNDGGPAFPSVQPEGPMTGNCNWGMSLRNWFAGMALNGWIGTYGEDACPIGDIEECQSVAKLCYQLADAMLAEMEKQK